MTKIVFFGSSVYSNVVLSKLISLPDFKVVAVVSKIDKPFGRDQKITPNPVAQFALDNQLKLIQLEEFTDKLKTEICQLKADLGLCVAFGPPFFDDDMINSFPLKIINIHPSALPKYRGATPGPWQIINGETSSAVTFFQIDPLPDHGPIISQISFDISPTETAETFYQKAFALASNHLEAILKSYIINHKSILTEQDHSQKSYFPKFTKETAKIDWNWDLNKIERFVRAMLPWPVAWTKVKNQNGDIFTMKIFSINLRSNPDELIPNLVQVEGKSKTLWKQIEKYYQILKQS